MPRNSNPVAVDRYIAARNDPAPDRWAQERDHYRDWLQHIGAPVRLSSGRRIPNQKDMSE